MALVDLDGAWPQWMEDAGEVINDFWNTHIYGEQITTTTSYGELEHLMYGYSQHETSSTIKSEVHTGTIIVKETTITNGKVDVGYSINMPTYNLKDGKSIGIPTSIGISAGDTGINISASIGLDLIAPKLSVNANLGFSMEELISAKVNADMGWLNNKVGLGAKLPISAWESLRLFCYKQDMKNGITQYDEYGVHIKMGVVYVVAVIGILAYGVVIGSLDLQMALQQLQRYWNSLTSCSLN